MLHFTDLLQVELVKKAKRAVVTEELSCCCCCDYLMQVNVIKS